MDVLHGRGLLTVPAGKDVLRVVPPLTVTRAELEEGAAILDAGLHELSARLEGTGAVSAAGAH